MSKKLRLGANSKSGTASLDVPRNSSILLSGRCTSTPISTNRLSFSRLMDTSVGGFETTRDTCSTPMMNVSAVPIFGRQNLKLLSDCRSRGDESGIKKILQKHKVRQPCANVEKTFDHSSINVPSSSSAFRRNSKKDTKKNINKVNTRRSSVNDSRIPVFKVTPKVPKSPRLLTAMRAKLRANRDKVKNANNAETVVVEKNDKKIGIKKQERCSLQQKTQSSKVYSKYKITVPVSPKFRKTKCPSNV